MKIRQKLTGLIVGIGLFVAAGVVQAGNVGFSISYSDYGHGNKRHAYSHSYNHNYSQSYRHSYPANHIIQYNYHPYYGIKHYQRQHVHNAYCKHGYSGHNYSDRKYPDYKYQKHYYKHQKDEYNKHKRRESLHNDAYYWDRHRMQSQGYDRREQRHERRRDQRHD